jgi:membrane associated rhomboid family serine protease
MVIIKKGFDYWAIKLAAAITAVFLISIILPDIVNEFSLISALVVQRPWTLITKMFLHADFVHLAYNMIGLLVFGSILEHYVGGRRFLLIFFGTGLAAGIGSLAFYSSAIGASGAIFGVMGALAVIRPKQLAWAMGAPMPMLAAAVVYAILDFALFFSADNVAHASHLIGLALGAIIGLELRARMPRMLKQNEKDNEPEDNITEEMLDEWERRYMMA